MNKLSVLVFALFAGLTAWGFLIRQQPRRVPRETGTPPAGAIREVPALDAWQGGIRPDASIDYTADAAARRRLLEKLRDAARNQPPPEGHD